MKYDGAGAAHTTVHFPNQYWWLWVPMPLPSPRVAWGALVLMLLGGPKLGVSGEG